jgi:hypothetical protein
MFELGLAPDADDGYPDHPTRCCCAECWTPVEDKDQMMLDADEDGNG